MKFQLEIELGNDAMQTRRDIEEVLRRTGQNLAYMCDPPEDGDEGPIFDLNGNKVGTWTVTGQRQAYGQCISEEELASEREQLSTEDRDKLDALPNG
jgi:hypothetical protein